MAKTADAAPPPIAVNRKARFDYFIEERLEAGLSLLGWEVKSMRAGKAQIAEAYVYLKSGEAFLFGAHIAPLISASTHVDTDPTRTRKLLLNRKQLDHLVGAVERRDALLRGGTLEARRNASRQEFRIARHIVDQREHLRRRCSDDGATIDDLQMGDSAATSRGKAEFSHTAR